MKNKYFSKNKINHQANKNNTFADYDKLTGLKNEKALLKDFNINTHSGIILYLDICNFREINLIFGAEVGDNLLITFASRLRENHFESYRIQGDEFVIISYEKADSLEIDTLVNYIFDLISKEAFLIGTEEIFLTVRIGVLVINHNHEVKKNSIAKLVYNASFAMKHAKEKKIQYALYNLDLMNTYEDSSPYLWKKKLATAINNDIVTVYQSIVDTKTKLTNKYEAFVRLQDEQNNFISSHKVLISSKAYGLYNRLTKAIINNVFETIFKTDCEVLINISIYDIRNLSTIKMILNRLQNIPKEKTEKIIFELLESEGIENYDEIKDFIKSVKKFGCKIAVDDFGSGYSNLGHILNLDIDYIKIDAEIIKNIIISKNSEIIAKFIVNFSKKIGAKTIAEFVNSKEIFEKVLELDIDYAQGLYFSEPKEFESM